MRSSRIRRWSNAPIGQSRGFLERAIRTPSFSTSSTSSKSWPSRLSARSSTMTKSLAFPAGTSGGRVTLSSRFSGTVTSMVAAVFITL